MKKILGLMVLCGAMAAMPVLAQETPLQTNENQSAGHAEERAVRAGADLIAVTPEQAHANALKRCDNLPAFYKSDCVKRVDGDGDFTGSVQGGGILMESVTTMPESKLNAEIRNAGTVQLPAQPQRQHRR